MAKATLGEVLSCIHQTWSNHLVLTVLDEQRIRIDNCSTWSRSPWRRSFWVNWNMWWTSNFQIFREESILTSDSTIWNWILNDVFQIILCFTLEVIYPKLSWIDFLLLPTNHGGGRSAFGERRPFRVGSMHWISALETSLPSETVLPRDWNLQIFHATLGRTPSDLVLMDTIQR